MAQLTFAVHSWGGMNARDQADELILRSHAQTQAGFTPLVVGGQPIGTESPDCLNVDYSPKGLRKRLGSASYADLSATIPSGDSVLCGAAFVNADATSYELIVTTTTIMTNASGSWAQITASSGATAFTFAAAATKASILYLDGHAFVAANAAGQNIVTTRSGTTLDGAMASGNTYADAYGAGTHVITGTWPTAVHQIASCNGRLCIGEEGLLIEFTPMAQEASSGIWDLNGATAGAFHTTSGELRFMCSFIPKGGNEKTDEQLMIGTSGGIESTTGFQDYDRLNVEQGAEGVLNHKCFCKCNNWIVYLTRNRNVHAYNGDEVIDLGSRMRTSNADGFLDGMDVATSETYAYAVYSEQKKQAILRFCSSTARVNDSAAVVDFKRGEPVPGEPADSFERRVRVLPWQIASPDGNDWFIHGYTKYGIEIGLMADGTTFTTESGLNDKGTLGIDGYWKSPIVTGGAGLVTLQKQWVRLQLRAEQSGKWAAAISEYHDREDDPTKTWNMTLVKTGTPIVGTAVIPFTLTSGGDVRDFDRIDKRSEAFQWQMENSADSQDFSFTHAAVTYEIGAEVN